jgi:carbon-monoxide dehydrogenase medium subunit
MFPNQFDYHRPTSIQDALALLAKHQDDAKLLAGGQSLVSMLKLRLANPACLVDLAGIGGLSYIREEGDKIAIGAMTTYADLKDSKLLQAKCPLLPAAAAVVGDVQVRNRGTIGGSVAHADPAGDVPTALLALDAEIKATGPKGERWLKAGEFFEGMYATQLAADEILTEVRVPVKSAAKSCYMKAARRPSDFAIVGMAAYFTQAKDGRCERIAIAVTGVTDKPYRAAAAEAKLKGTKLDAADIAAAAPLVTEGMDLVSNMHAGAEFRRHLAGVYLARVIAGAA